MRSARAGQAAAATCARLTFPGEQRPQSARAHAQRSNARGNETSAEPEGALVLRLDSHKANLPRRRLCVALPRRVAYQEPKECHARVRPFDPPPVPRQGICASWSADPATRGVDDASPPLRAGGAAQRQCPAGSQALPEESGFFALGQVAAGLSVNGGQRFAVATLRFAPERRPCATPRCRIRRRMCVPGKTLKRQKP